MNQQYKQTRRTEARATKRQRSAAMRVAAKRQHEKMQEERDEKISPAAQRNAVVDATGAVLRGPRVVPDGVTFIRSNPIRRMYEIGKGKGDAALIRKHHWETAERLQWAREHGQHVGQVPSSLGERVAGAITTGWISDTKLKALGYQTRMGWEFAGASVFLGALWPIVERIALDGADVATVAVETCRSPDVTRGYLVAALDRLVEYYRTIDAPPRLRRIVL